MKPWLQYSLIRFGVFAGVFALLMLVPLDWWLAAIIAAVISLCVGYIFFRKLRDAVALDLADLRTKPTADTDAAAEDRVS